MNRTRNYEVARSIPGLAQWVKNPVLLWLWCRPLVTALIRPLAWEPPYAAGATLEKAKRQKGKKAKKRKKKKKKKKEREREFTVIQKKINSLSQDRLGHMDIDLCCLLYLGHWLEPGWAKEGYECGERQGLGERYRLLEQSKSYRESSAALE